MKKLAVLFVIAFLLRILLINVAFHGDLYNNLSWGNTLVRYGAKGFYEIKVWDHSVPNQPPLYILLFGLTSFLNINIGNLFNYLNNNIGIFPSSLIWFWQQNGNIILLKLPSILADLGIGYLIYRFTKKQTLAILWLFNPITFYNSTIWGQTDAIVNLLGLISIYFLVDKKLVKSLLFLTLSLLFKGSLAIFVPILITYAILQKYSLKTWFKSIVYCLVTIVLVSVWFHPNINLPIWLINLYGKQILPGEIGDLSANAFNLWYLINPGKVLDSIKYYGIAAHTIGYAITLFVMVLMILKLKTRNSEKNLFYALAIIALTSFLFMTRIHERYLYPFFPVAIILVGLVPEFLIPYTILSVTFLLNMYNLFWAPGIPTLQNILLNSSLPSILAVLNIVTYGVILKFLL